MKEVGPGSGGIICFYKIKSMKKYISEMIVFHVSRMNRIEKNSHLVVIAAVL